jgi:SAM-dependent methyltransferase
LVLRLAALMSHLKRSDGRTGEASKDIIVTDNYDEAYYQDGSERGTQYRNYLESAKLNRTYFEIAETIVDVLKPKRTLEIGCATGAIVSHLRTFDVDAHGIDVSEWAVQNSLAPTVQVASAADLPFEDNSFDVVYSVHALEHLPTDIKDKALSELSRVCSGFQFHMIPMLESGPYVGDRFGHLLNLRTDPTHNLLYERGWWIDQFGRQQWVDTGTRLSVIHDNIHYELSACQILLSRTEASPDILRRAANHNFKAAEALSLALNGKPGPGLDVHIRRLKGEDI